jgi:hypothetical protein
MASNTRNRFKSKLLKLMVRPPFAHGAMVARMTASCT